VLKFKVYMYLGNALAEGIHLDIFLRPHLCHSPTYRHLQGSVSSVHCQILPDARICRSNAKQNKLINHCRQNTTKVNTELKRPDAVTRGVTALVRSKAQHL
jgi:hypothetical protein